MNTYTYTAPVRIGDKLYALIDYDDMQVVEELTVTEVGVKGCFVSGIVPPRGDFGDYIEYGDIGKMFFLSRGEVLA